LEQSIGPIFKSPATLVLVDQSGLLVPWRWTQKAVPNVSN